MVLKYCVVLEKNKAKQSVVAVVVAAAAHATEYIYASPLPGDA